MTITGLTNDLSKNALRCLTAHASRPESTTLAVDQWTRTPAYVGFGPLKKGAVFHRALARFLARGFLRPYEIYYPFMSTIRSYLRDQGYNRFEAEVEVGSRSVKGRADIIAKGLDHSAVVEVKVVSVLPSTPHPQHVVQTALPGFLLNNGGKQMFLFYVDLTGAEIRAFSWSDFRSACFKPWELKAA